MKILIVNDDGFRGAGLHSLINALKSEYDLTVIVPEAEQSGKSHSMTFLEPLFIDSMHISEVDFDVYSVKGSPADCVSMALDLLFPDENPDLIISGINKGYNAGGCIIYSGTVSAAYEGAARGIPAFALSAGFTDANFEEVANAFKKMLPLILEKEGDNPFFYNINFPNIPASQWLGIKKTTIASELLSTKLEKRIDPFSRVYYWHGYVGNGTIIGSKTGTDLEAIEEGYISVSPIKPEYLDREKFQTMPDFTDVFDAVKKK